MAHVLYEQGIEDVATYYARKALKISPSNANAAELLQKLQFAPAKVEFVHKSVEKEEVIDKIDTEKYRYNIGTIQK